MSVPGTGCAVSVAEVNAYLAESMPLHTATVDELARDYARVRWPYDEANTRPGGYISGPTMMSLVDLAAWVAVFTRAGITPMAVTWDLKINFLRPALGRDLVAEAFVRKFGRLTFMDVPVHLADEPDRLVAHATVTYAVPDA